jgi:hypothetical protein
MFVRQVLTLRLPTNIDVFFKDYAIIMGHVATCEEMRERYRVDEVKLFPFSDIFYLICHFCFMIFLILLSHQILFTI